MAGNFNLLLQPKIGVIKIPEVTANVAWGGITKIYI
jgi:hypothetical protein